MTRESKSKRAEIINGRSGQLEQLNKKCLEAQKNEQTRTVHLTPATKFQDRFNALRTAFGEDGVNCSETARKQHGKDLELHHLHCPDIVVYPENVEQIQWLCKYASEHQIPLIPYGLGSSIKGQTGAISGGISINMSKMNRVLEFRPEDRTIRLQAGITKNALADYLSESNLFLPIEIGNCDASIGGMIGTNARGSLAAFYGSMKDFVLALKVVTADGNILCTGRQANATSSLTGLFVGAEGTLGVVVEATLKLMPIPRAISCAIATFDTLENALASAIQIYRQNLTVQRCELLDARAIASINAFHSTKFHERAHLFIETHGSNRAAADSVIEECKDICREGGLTEYVQFTDEEDAPLPMLWTAKSTVWMSAIRQFPSTELTVADVAVPMSRMKDLLTDALKGLLESKLNWSALICQVGLGSLTLLLPCRAEDKSCEAVLKTFMNRLHAKTLQLDGTVTAQYGVGSEKREELEQELGKEAISVMRHIKRSLDPKNILNPVHVAENLNAGHMLVMNPMQNNAFQQRFDRASPQERLRMIDEDRLRYINFPTSQGETVLHAAVRYSIRDLLDKVLARPGVDLDVFTKDGMNALNLAAKAGNPRIMQQLLEAGADVFALDKNDRTVLHHITSLNAGETFRVIFDHLLVPRIKENKSGAAKGFFSNMFGSSQSERQPKPVVMSQIYDFIMWKDRDDETFLGKLIKSPALLKTVLENSLVTDALRATETNFYYQLASNFHQSKVLSEIMLDLLVQGHPVNAFKVDGCSVLHIAFHKNVVPVAEFLIKAGEDPCERCDSGFSAFHHAVQTRNDKIFKTFKCTDPVVLGECYVIASKHNCLSILETMRDMEFDLSSPAILHYALKIEADNLIARLGMEYEYSPKDTQEIFRNAVTSGQTELFNHIKAKIDHFDPEVLNKLLFEIVDSDDLTDKKLVEFVDYLLELGADVKATNSVGKNLIYVAKRGPERPALLEHLKTLTNEVDASSADEFSPSLSVSSVTVEEIEDIEE